MYSKGGIIMPVPIVKTGPTSGQERSRNKDGRWRKKRDDSGKPREKSSDNSKDKKSNN